MFIKFNITGSDRYYPYAFSKIFVKYLIHTDLDLYEIEKSINNLTRLGLIELRTDVWLGSFNDDEYKLYPTILEKK